MGRVPVWLIGLAALGLPAELGSARAGDFGRPDPNPFRLNFSFSFDRHKHTLAETEEEKELHDRLWRFLHAPQSAGWFDGERFAQPRARPQPVAVDAYYRWLGQAGFQASRTQYAAIADAVDAELGTLPSTFAAACAVVELDRQRQIALGSLPGTEPGLATALADRQARNAAEIGSFAFALRVRFEAYSYALDHVLVEVPDRAAVAVDARLGELEYFVHEASAGRFCTEPAIVIVGRGGEQPLRSREEGPVRFGAELN